MARTEIVTAVTVMPPEASSGSSNSGDIERNHALDGIRAIAVLGVMLFHFGQTWLPGGYLGVDVFFVLSGFLITRVLLGEQRRAHRISIRAFWARRARRLFPALGLMLLVVATFSAGASALTQRQVYQQGLATLAYVNNWWLWADHNAYFDQFASPSPLLHTWSLGIEEQFYLLFPFLLLLGIWLFRSTPKHLAWALAGLAVASGIWGAALVLVEGDTTRAFFGTDVRAQELLVGAAFASLLVGRQPGKPTRCQSVLGAHTTTLGLLGGLLVVAMMFAAAPNARWLYLGGMLVLSVAVVAIIAAALDTASPIHQVLAWSPLAWVGLISYGLYLWHWPVAVWLGGSGMRLRFADLLLGIAATFAIAAPSYYLLERPIQQQRWNWQAGRSGIAVLAAAPLVIAGIITDTTTARSQVVANPDIGIVVPAGDYIGKGPKVFLVGDSISENLRSMFAAYPNPGFALNGNAKLGCGIAPNQIAADGKPAFSNFPCDRWAALWPKDIVRVKPLLALANIGPFFHEDIVANDGVTIVKWGTPQYHQWFVGVLDELAIKMRAGAREVGFLDNTCSRAPGDSSIVRAINDDSRTTWVNLAMLDYARKHPTVHLVNLSGWDCGANGMEATRNAKDRKWDGMHYTKAGSLEAWSWIGPQIKEIVEHRPIR